MFLDVNSAHVRLAVAMDTTQKNPSEVDSAISTEHLGRSISGMCNDWIESKFAINLNV